MNSNLSQTQSTTEASKMRLSGAQVMSVDALHKLPANDFHRKKVGDVRRQMQREWNDHSSGRSNESVRGSWQDHGGPEGYIASLADDIRQHGLREPLVIAHIKSAGRDRQVLWDGHHRAQAAVEAGLNEVPVVHHDRDHLLGCGDY